MMKPVKAEIPQKPAGQGIPADRTGKELTKSKEGEISKQPEQENSGGERGERDVSQAAGWAAMDGGGIRSQP